MLWTFTRRHSPKGARAIELAETIVYEGHYFDYHIRKTRGVLEQTMRPDGAHIPYSLRLARKGDQEGIITGCIVVPSLPVIDQLLALWFHLQDPADEAKLVEKTNWNTGIPRSWWPRSQAAA